MEFLPNFISEDFSKLKLLTAWKLEHIERFITFKLAV